MPKYIHQTDTNYHKGSNSLCVKALMIVPYRARRHKTSILGNRFPERRQGGIYFREEAVKLIKEKIDTSCDNVTVLADSSCWEKERRFWVEIWVYHRYKKDLPSPETIVGWLGGWEVIDNLLLEGLKRATRFASEDYRKELTKHRARMLARQVAEEVVRKAAERTDFTNRLQRLREELHKAQDEILGEYLEKYGSKWGRYEISTREILSNGVGFVENPFLMGNS